MKQLICEMCGGSDLVKQNDLYVCQHCGAKYTVEEARKMMVEGTVKIDTTEQTDKFLENARRAKQKEDWAEVEKYYNLVEQNDPSNIEAIFYSAYGKARNTLHIADYYQKQAAFDVLTKSVSILDDRFDVKDADGIYDTLLEIEKDIRALFGCQFVYRTVKDVNGNIKESDQGKTENLFKLPDFFFPPYWLHNSIVKVILSCC